MYVFLSYVLCLICEAVLCLEFVFAELGQARYKENIIIWVGGKKKARKITSRNILYLLLTQSNISYTHSKTQDQVIFTRMNLRTKWKCLATNVMFPALNTSYTHSKTQDQVIFTRMKLSTKWKCLAINVLFPALISISLC